MHNMSLAELIELRDHYLQQKAAGSCLTNFHRASFFEDQLVAVQRYIDAKMKEAQTQEGLMDRSKDAVVTP